MVTPPTIQVASFGMWDSLILMVMALVVFGPRRLPEIGRQIGRLLYEVRKASNDFKFQMEEELRNAEEADRRKKEDERLRLLALSAPAQTAGTIEANSQPPEAASGTNGESPYAGEAVYPPVTASAPEVPAEETYPRILPPSTGEPVPAERPASAGPGLIGQDFTPGIEAAESTSEVSQTDSQAPQQPSPDPEPAPHG
jgi:sec-independent protein translocase protein TatB